MVSTGRKSSDVVFGSARPTRLLAITTGAVCRDPEDQLAVHEFWHDEIFTTERYR